VVEFIVYLSNPLQGLTTTRVRDIYQGRIITGSRWVERIRSEMSGIVDWLLDSKVE